MAETIAQFLEGTAGVADPVVRQLARACQHEIAKLRAYVVEIDPSVTTSRVIRPLADVEQEHIEGAVRAMGGNASAAARLLEIAPETVCRKLREYERRRQEAAMERTR